MRVEARVVNIPGDVGQPTVTAWIAKIVSDNDEELGHGMGLTEEGARHAAAQSMVENAAKAVRASTPARDLKVVQS